VLDQSTVDINCAARDVTRINLDCDHDYITPERFLIVLVAMRAEAIPVYRAHLVLFSICAFGVLCACNNRSAATMKRAGGDPHAGAEKVVRYDCVGCHQIPGTTSNAKGLIGAPSLAGMARRNSIAGEVANTPENMLRWLRDPKSLKPNTTMPDMGINEQDSKDIAAFLYTLE
jgi:cytochrome c2